jgi:hypothetical protein
MVIQHKVPKLKVKQWLSALQGVAKGEKPRQILEAAYQYFWEYGATDGDTQSSVLHSGVITRASLIARAKRHLKDGKIGTAGRCLSEIDVLQREQLNNGGYMRDAAIGMPLERRREIIAALHPERRDPATGFDVPANTPIEEESAAHLVVTADEAIQHVIRMTKGKAAGADGWVDNVLRWFQSYATLQDNAEAAATSRLGAALAGFANRIYAGRLSSRSIANFTRTRSVVFEKPGQPGSFRPIGIRSILYRYVTRMAADLLGPKIGQMLAPIQLAVGTKDGCGIGVRIAQAWFDTPPTDSRWQSSKAILSLDVKNCYNSLDRGQILQALRDKAPEAVRLFRICYDGPSTLYFGTGCEVGRAETGVLQGDPMANIYSGLALEKPYEAIRRRLDELDPSDSAVVAYADDGNCLGSLGTAISMVAECVKILEEHGLEAVKRKFILAGRDVHRMPPPRYARSFHLKASR